MRKPNTEVPPERRCLSCLGWGFYIRRENDCNEPYDCPTCAGSGYRKKEAKQQP
jgi:hypothetical protein